MPRISLTAKDGRALAAYRFDPEGPARAKLIIAAAMAVPQSFYAAFARYLAGRGYAVWTFDYRGIGESLSGSLRGFEADLGDWLEQDYEALLLAVAEESPALPLFIVGHSFGGQVAPLLPSRERLSGLVNIAVGSGSLRHLRPRLRLSAPLLWYVLAPLLCPIFGYFPGARLGVVGDLPAAAMMQWRRWCLAPDYLLSGEPGARAAYASADYPVLALSFVDDELLRDAGSRLLHDAYLRRPVDYRLLEAAQFGLPRIGHFGFFKPQSEATLWPVVADWLELASSRGGYPRQ